MIDFKKIKELRNELYSIYKVLYNEDGYICARPLNLVATEDITLEFVNCTICKAKPFLSSRKNKQNDYILFQPCIRTKNYNYVMDASHFSRYSSSFTMMGGFKSVSMLTWGKDYLTVIYREATFLRHFFRYVKLTIPIQYKDYLELSEELKEIFDKMNVEIEYSTNDEEHLKWKYGIKNVVGYGTRWEIKTANDQNLTNWGNTVVIVRDGVPIGIDFGGGVETLIQSYYRLEHCILANQFISQPLFSLCNQNKNYIKLSDSLICLINIALATKNLSECSLHIKYIFRYYIRALCSWSIMLDIQESFLYQLVNSIVDALNNSTTDKKELKRFVVNQCQQRFLELGFLSESDKVNRCIKAIYIDGKIDNEKYRQSYLHMLEPIEILSIRKIQEKM